MTIALDGNPGRVAEPALIRLRAATEVNDLYLGNDGNGNLVVSGPGGGEGGTLNPVSAGGLLAANNLADVSAPASALANLQAVWKVKAASYGGLLTDSGVIYDNLSGATTHTLPTGAPVGFYQYVERWDNGGNDLKIAVAGSDNIQQNNSTVTGNYYVGRYGEIVLCKVIAVAAGNATWSMQSNMGETVVTSGWIAVPSNGTVVASQMMMGGKRSIKYAAIRVDSAVTSGSITVEPSVNGAALGAGNEALSSGTSGVGRQSIGQTNTNASGSPWSLDIIIATSSPVGPSKLVASVAVW